MTIGLGSKAKAAFRIEGGAISGKGLVNTAYPRQPDSTTPHGDEEEVLLKSSDLLPLLSESYEELNEHQLNETLLGTPALSDSDRVSRMADGSKEIAGYYDALNQLIAAVMGYEHPGTDAVPVSPDYTQGTAEKTGTATGAQGSTKIVDTGNPFAAGDVGKFVMLYGANVAAGQIRRISVHVGADELTITPAWDVDPINASTLYVVSQEFQHLFEMARQLHTELWVNEYTNYPIAGVYGATDKIVRRATFGVQKGGSKPWVFRSMMLNILTLSIAAGQGMRVSINGMAFDIERDSATNGANSAANWAWDNASTLFSSNEKIMWSDIDFFRIDEYSASVPLTGADNYGISEFEVTINNGLKGDDQDALTADYRVEPVRGGFREVTGRFVLPRYSDDTFRNWVSNQTRLMAHIKFSGSQISTVARSFEIFLTSIKLTDPKVPVSGPDVIKQEYNFRGFIPAAQPNGFPTQNMTTPRSEIMIRVFNQFPFNALLDHNQEY